MSMRVIAPIDIKTGVGSGQQLIAISATETAYPAWVTATAYTAGTSFVLYNRRIYKCLVSHTSGPSTLPGAIGGVTWNDLGPTNQWAMFDQEWSTATTATGSLTATVKPSTAAVPAYFDSVAVLSVGGAASVQVQVFKGAGRTTGPGGAVGNDLVFKGVANLDDSTISDTWQYGFAPFDVKTELIFSGVPPYLNAEVVLTITGTSGGTTVSCGSLICGLSAELGDVELGASVGITDFSVKETDAFGITTLIVRGFSKPGTYSLSVKKSEIRRVYNVLANLRARNAVWIGSDDYDYSPLVIFGFPEDFLLTVKYRTYSVFGLSVQGTL